MGKKSILKPALAALLLALPAVVSAHHQDTTQLEEQESLKQGPVQAAPVRHHVANPVVDDVAITCKTAGGEVTIYLPASLAKLLVDRDCCWYAQTQP